LNSAVIVALLYRAIGVYQQEEISRPFRERCKKKGKKNLTNVSYAFTHTYTPKKLTFFLFPQAYLNNFEKCEKTPTTKVGRGWGRYNSPLWPKYHPIWFKTSTLKDNCLFKLLLGKKGKKTNISPFSANFA